MRALAGSKILLGVTGGIAAYKSAYLVRLLTQAGAEVKVIMTPEARSFIGTVTMSTLSGNPVQIDFFNEETGEWANHVGLGLWADLMLIAPLTANTAAKMVNGQADNLLLATYLSAKCRTMVAPAMDLDMWKHPSTADNIRSLEERGVLIIEPGTGELASGLIGKGRMAEPDQILEAVTKLFDRANQPLYGKHVLLTAGPTYEELDPVRFIGNYSTGKMGFALAEAFFRAGAEVTVVHGPVNIDTSSLPYHTERITSADQMLKACQDHFDQSDVFLAAAAVADYAPAERSEGKIKKKDGEDELVLRLKKNPDILATLSASRKPGQVIGGFALETGDAIENGRKKLEKKNLDFIVINTLEDEGAGFGGDTNRIRILDKGNNLATFELKSKEAVAKDIVRHLLNMQHV